MNTFYFLSSCTTCKRILKELNLPKSVVLQDIKTQPLSEDQLDLMAQLAGSYEALFSRRALKYKAMGLKEKTLNEQDYKTLILKEYTFLKRPVVLLDNQIFVGNSPKTLEAAKAALSK